MPPALIKQAKRFIKRIVRRQGAIGDHAASHLSPSAFALHARDGALHLHGVPLDTLTKTFGSPLHVVDLAKLRDNAMVFAKAHPRIETFYSYKTNPIARVLSEIHRHNIGAEVISEYELWLALKLGVPPNQIVLNGPVKSTAALETAIGRDIACIGINHPEELNAIATIAERLGKRPRVLVRITTPASWGGQFGAAVENGAAMATATAALRNPAVELVGVHSHRGGMIDSVETLSAHVNAVLAFVSTLRAELGFECQIVDLGGSLASTSVYALTQRQKRFNQTLRRPFPKPDVDGGLTIARALEVIDSEVSRQFSGRTRPRVFIEPGRALTSNTQMLLATVHQLKRDDEMSFAILDAGINHAESARNEYHELFNVDRADAPRSSLYTVVGPICTPGDLLYPSVALAELNIGSTLAIMDAGAYFVPFSTSFSFPKPSVVGISETGAILPLRRGESFDDLIAFDVPITTSADAHTAESVERKHTVASLSAAAMVD